jgi:hypothetical protein
VSDSPSPVRSYQRIFKPDRRIYQIDGRRLPVPGGVPLAWLGWAVGALLVVLVLSTRSLLFTAVATVIGGALGAERGWRGVLIAGVCVAVVVQCSGVLLGWIDWPLRLLILPGLVATAAGQLTPDGRAGHLYLFSRIAVRLRVGRRSLGRPVAVDGEQWTWAPRVWFGHDEHHPVLHHGRVHGPARIVFARRVVLTPARGRLIARPAAGRRVREGETVALGLDLDEGQVVEVRS